MTEFRDGSFSDEALKCLARKREVNKAETLFEITGQFPSPSKDFCQLKITSEGVIWRRWKISIRGVNHGTAPTPMPIEEVLSYEDYQYHNVLQEEIQRTFGLETIRNIQRVTRGYGDDLDRLSQKLLVNICLYLDLKDIEHLSQVNSRWRYICKSDKLWKKLYRQHHGSPASSSELDSLAMKLTWKTVYYMNKLQLQKELSRRRQQSLPYHVEQRSTPLLRLQSLPATFLTDNSGNSTPPPSQATICTENLDNSTPPAATT